MSTHRRVATTESLHVEGSKHPNIFNEVFFHPKIFDATVGPEFSPAFQRRVQRLNHQGTDAYYLWARIGLTRRCS